jgi:hypothetical protein
MPGLRLTTVMILIMGFLQLSIRCYTVELEIRGYKLRRDLPICADQRIRTADDSAPAPTISHSPLPVPDINLAQNIRSHRGVP